MWKKVEDNETDKVKMAKAEKREKRNFFLEN